MTILKKRILPIFLCALVHIVSLAQDSRVGTLNNVNFNRLNSSHLEQLELQAHLLFVSQDYEAAASSYLSIIDYNIDDAGALYKLACCYAMLNKPSYASNFLALAINAGYNDFSGIQQEECFKLIKNDSQFKQTINDIQKLGKRFGDTFYIEADVLVRCRVIFPDNFDKTKPYDLIVGLHGYGGTAEGFSGVANYFESKNYIFIIPEAPYLKNEQGRRKFQYSWDFDVIDKELWKVSDPYVIDYIIRVFDYFNQIFNVNNNYLLGFSQGAAYAYAAAVKNSDKIDAVIACGGRLPDAEKYPWFISKDDLEKGRGLKVCILHGRNDAVISYKNSAQAKKVFSKLNYDVKMILFEGGHNVNKEALNKGLDWIKKEKE